MHKNEQVHPVNKCSTKVAIVKLFLHTRPPSFSYNCIIGVNLFVSIENYIKTEFSRYVRIVDIESPSTLLPLDVDLKNME
jgi:hypothetical protein